MNLRHVVRWVDRPIVLTGVTINAILIIIIAGLLGRVSPAQVAAVAVPTASLPIVIIQTAPAAVPSPAVQVAASQPNITSRPLVSYTAPDGVAYPDPIIGGAHYQVLATFGPGWIEIQVDGYPAPVWVRAGRLLGIADVADLAPTATPIVVREPAQPALIFAPPTPAWVAPTPATLDQSDPACTGAADGTIAASCGLTPAQLREAEQR